MQAAAPLLPAQQAQHQLQQNPLGTLQQLQQQRQPIHANDVAMEEAQEQHHQQEPAASLPADPFGSHDGHAAWVQLQVEQMFQDAGGLIEDTDASLVRPLTEATKHALQLAFLNQFDSMLQDEATPTQGQVRSWLRHHLGIPEATYGADSDDDVDDTVARQQRQLPQLTADAAAAATCQDAQPQGQQQQPDQAAARLYGRKQKQQLTPCRRSSRSNLGQISAGFAAVFGSSSQQAAGSVMGTRGVGKGGSNQKQQAGTRPEPSTPAAVPPPPPRSRSRGGRRAR